MPYQVDHVTINDENRPRRAPEIETFSRRQEMYFIEGVRRPRVTQKYAALSGISSRLFELLNDLENKTVPLNIENDVLVNIDRLILSVSHSKIAVKSKFHLKHDRNLLLIFFLTRVSTSSNSDLSQISTPTRSVKKELWIMIPLIRKIASIII